MATYEWESVTLGQNAEIQKIVAEAARASDFVTTNIGLAKSGLQLAQAFLLGVLNPKVLILNAIADEFGLGGIFQKNWQWFHTKDNKTVPFVDGMKIK